MISPKGLEPLGVQHPVPRLLSTVGRVLFLLVMALGAVFITMSSLEYFEPGTVAPFVIEKLPVRFEALWLGSLRVHVIAALVSFPLCIALMTRAVQRRPTLHRLLGRIAGVLVLFALVPSGVVLAFDAKGGSLVTAGFLVSGALTAWFMATGALAARRRELVRHRRAMLHVFAQMSVAVTSRAMLVGLDVAGTPPALAYVVALWAPVLVSALVAELLSASARTFPALVRLLQQRIDHGLRKMGSSLRLRALVRPFVRIGR